MIERRFFVALFLEALFIEIHIPNIFFVNSHRILRFSTDAFYFPFLY